MIKNIILLAAVTTILSACSGERSAKIAALKKNDKNLSCEEIMLEINEAEFYRTKAEKNKTPKVENLIMPLGYISTYMDAQEAANTANERVDYLNRIYDIMNCDDVLRSNRTASSNVPDKTNEIINSAPPVAYSGGGYAPVNYPYQYRVQDGQYWNNQNWVEEYWYY